MTPAIRWCPLRATAPRDCGQVAVQITGYQPDGTPVVWRCTFCAAEAKRTPPGETHKLTLDIERLS